MAFSHCTATRIVIFSIAALFIGVLTFSTIDPPKPQGKKSRKKNKKSNVSSLDEQENKPVLSSAAKPEKLSRAKESAVPDSGYVTPQLGASSNQDLAINSLSDSTAFSADLLDSDDLVDMMQPYKLPLENIALADTKESKSNSVFFTADLSNNDIKAVSIKSPKLEPNATSEGILFPQMTEDQHDTKYSYDLEHPSYSDAIFINNNDIDIISDELEAYVPNGMPSAQETLESVLEVMGADPDKRRELAEILQQLSSYDQDEYSGTITIKADQSKADLQSQILDIGLETSIAIESYSQNQASPLSPIMEEKEEDAVLQEHLHNNLHIPNGVSEKLEQSTAIASQDVKDTCTNLNKTVCMDNNESYDTNSKELKKVDVSTTLCPELDVANGLVDTSADFELTEKAALVEFPVKALNSVTLTKIALDSPMSVVLSVKNTDLQKTDHSASLESPRSPFVESFISSTPSVWAPVDKELTSKPRQSASLVSNQKHHPSSRSSKEFSTTASFNLAAPEFVPNFSFEDSHTSNIKTANSNPTPQVFNGFNINCESFYPAGYEANIDQKPSQVNFEQSLSPLRHASSFPYVLAEPFDAINTHDSNFDTAIKPTAVPSSTSVDYFAQNMLDSIFHETKDTNRQKNTPFYQQKSTSAHQYAFFPEKTSHTFPSSKSTSQLLAQSKIDSPKRGLASNKINRIKCKFGDSCHKKDHDCAYFHPKEKCTFYPNCKYDQECTFIHPSQ
ncbi:hypothetical protein MT418_003998 [Batrachochytrium dendrobatidis]